MLLNIFIGFFACCTINFVVSSDLARLPEMPKTSEHKCREELRSANNSDDLAKALKQHMVDVTALMNQELKNEYVFTGDVFVTRKGTVEICRVGACKFNNSTYKDGVRKVAIYDFVYSFDPKTAKVKVAKHHESDNERNWTPLQLDFTFSFVKPGFSYTHSEAISNGHLAEGIKLNVKMTVEPMTCQAAEIGIHIYGPRDLHNIKCRPCGKKEKILFRDAMNDQVKAALLRTVEPYVLKSVQDAICMSYIEPQVFVPFTGLSSNSS